MSAARDADNLQKLMDQYRGTAASSPAWFHLVDHIVTTLLSAEIMRAKRDMEYEKATAPTARVDR